MWTSVCEPASPKASLSFPAVLKQGYGLNVFPKAPVRNLMSWGSYSLGSQSIN